ncbi:tetratricopeptide repeat protein [Mucilaginibacter oryzae]|uniref:Tetratricopeptide repeat protein n=1 Tax=Mucilaginibacter oryzae TaxID=468058 RepID=A0A316GVH9_9SPHI|nr:tetratricopeptide repeat protein [Mucilaginibacter oryzae]PWK65771.1 tetratricopeptide repeat protein [Mucilaginibacter oryzae]
MDRQFFELSLARAWSFRRQGNAPKAVEYAKKTLEIAHKTDPECVMIALEFLGSSYETAGDFDNAFQCYARTLETGEKILRHYPDDIMGEIALCSAYAGLAGIDLKLQRYERAEILYKKLYDRSFKRLIPRQCDPLPMKENKRFHAQSCSHICDLYLATENGTQAIKYSHEFNLIMLELFEHDGLDPEIRSRLLTSYVQHGRALELTGRYQEAINCFDAALPLGEVLIAEYPDVYEFTEGFLSSLQSSGDLLSVLGNHAGALVRYEKGYVMVKGFFNKNLNDETAKFNLAVAACKVGGAYIYLNEPELAFPYLAEENRLYLELVREPSFKAEFYFGLSISYANLVLYYQQKRDMAGAKNSAHKRCDVLSSLAEKPSANRKYKLALKESFLALAKIYRNDNDHLSAKLFTDRASAIHISAI